MRNVYFLENNSTHDNSDVLVLKNISPNVNEKSELPVPTQEYFQYPNETLNHYLNSGIEDNKKLRNILIDSNCSIKKYKRILEFGCANSRVLRHLSDLHTDNSDVEIWGCDINSKTLLWSMENLSPPFNYFMNTTQPHMSFEDKHFDFIYCYSIFTHIDDLFYTWILELRRVLKVGGILFFTIHDESTINLVENSTRGLSKYIKQYQELFDDLMNNKINFLSIQRGHNSQVFVRRDYIVKLLEKHFDILSITENTMAGVQTGLLLKRIK